MTISQHV